jgi:cell division transport system ATP-binding protein
MPQFVGLHINMISVIIDKGVYVYTFVFFCLLEGENAQSGAFARLLRWHRGGLPVIRMSEATVVYENGTRAVNKASLRVDEGEFVFLVGASGSGKTTIIKLLTGEVRPSEGRVIVNNYDIGRMKKRQIPYLRRTLGVVYQDFRLINTKTVYENVAFAMRAIGAKGKAIKQRVPYVLDLVGLADKAHEKPMNLSGGEQQRVAIARALVNNPRLIIADEPTGNLDPARSLELMTLFEKINELGTTVLIVTHEKGLVDEFEKRVVVIDNGEVISDQTGGYYQI